MKVKPIIDQMLSDIIVLSGDVDSLTVGEVYWILSGTVNGKGRGVFTASIADATDFTSSDQVVSNGPFGVNIAGAAILRTVEPENLIIPSAYVVPITNRNKDENRLDSGFLQQTEDRFSVVTVTSMSQPDGTIGLDKRGTVAYDETDDIKRWIFSRLLNWIDSSLGMDRPIWFIQDSAVEMDRARLFWRFDFEATIQWDDCDGYEVVANDDLSTIGASYTLPEHYETLVGDVDTLVEGERFYIVPGSASINGKTQGAFVATSADVADFTGDDQLVRYIQAQQEIEDLDA